MNQFFKDLVFSSRAMRRNPVFTLTAAVTIALGIGASTAMFSVVNAVLLRPLPDPEPDRLALVFWENRAAGSKSFLYSNADFSDLRGGTSEIFEDMGGITSFRAFVTREDGSTEQIGKALVTANFLRLMGAKIALGRDFTDSDAVPQPAQAEVLIPPGSAAILSYEYWQRRYGGTERAIGNAIAGGPRIVGVLAPGFKLFFPAAARIDASPDFFVANNLGYDAAHRNLMTVGAIGRLRRGVTLARAQDRMDALRPSVRKHSFDPDAALELEPIERYLVEEVRPAILALMGAVIFLLLIACANVANLMLVRASMRERELAVRAALGASWWRLVRQMMTEAALLSVAGTALGVGLAWIGLFSLSDPGRETLYLTDGFWGIGASRYWMIRTAGDPAKYVAAVRAEIARIDPQLVVTKMRTMEALVERDQLGTRFSLLLIGAFAGVAVILACVGLYGVLATIVRHRTAEIGVRMALGAAPANIFRLVVGHGLRLSVCGVAIGLMAAAGLTRMIGAMLVGVTPTDPSTFVAMTALFLIVAALASWIPAARAAGLDPMAALHEQ